MDAVEELKHELLAACRIIATEGLADAFAHVSARVPGTRTMVFMPAKSPALVEYSDVFVTGLDEPVPQSSAHQAIYRLREDVGAIAHTHPPEVIARSLVGKTVQPVHNYSVIFHEGVPLYEAAGHVGGGEGGDEVARCLGQARAVVLQGHGAITVGADIREACLVALFLEQSARFLRHAAQLGEPVRYIPAERAGEIALQTFQASSRKRAWDHYKRKVGML